MKAQNQIKIKTPEEIRILRQGGNILSFIIKEVTCSLKSGITTQQVNAVAERLITDQKARPAFKGYRGFPASACISINQEVVHGIPGDRIIQDGDIVSIDIGVIYKGYFADMAVTVPVGKIEPKVKELLEVTKQSLSKGIKQAKANSHLSDISFAIQSFAENKGFSIVRDFVGHGIGKALHELPEVPNFGPPHCGPTLREGMVFCIEPMINVGTWQTRIAEDGWTVETLDGKPSAHFEHMIAITKAGPEVLTQFL